jgi:mRNA-degrading endonuclease RelE of RelBE toxin-antitoxin system
MSFAEWRPSASSVADDPGPYELVVAVPAARSIAEVLPEAVAAAVIELITGDLLDAPQMVGKPLRRELEGGWGARRGTFRVVYEIDHDRRELVVLRADHRRVIYRRG